MATKKQFKDTLRVVTARMHKEDRDNLTVNTVRNVAEPELGLPEGFFKGDEEWREMSRKIIYEVVQELDTIEIAAKNAASKTKMPAPLAKRKVPSPEKEVVLGDEASAEVYDEDEEEQQPRKKVKAVSKKASPAKKKTPVKKAAAKKTPVKKAAVMKTTPRKKKDVTPSDEEELSDVGEDDESEASFGDSEDDKPRKKTAARKGGKKVIESEDEESALSTPESESEAPKKKNVAKKASLKKAAAKKILVQKKKTVISDDEDEDSLSPPSADKEEESEVEMPAKKRQRGAPKMDDVKKIKVLAKDKKRLSSTQVGDSDSSNDADENDNDATPTSSAKFLAKLKKELGSDHKDEDEDAKSMSPAKTQKKKVVSDGGDEDEDEDVKKSPSKSPKKKQAAEDDESEMSDVKDPSPVKRGRKTAPTKSTKSASKTTKKTAAPKSTDPNAEEIKTLTQQLGKCGVRKVWGAYLKKEFGDDHRGKVRHLKEMLRDVGMEGRFSEQRAREIKEKRELEGDLEVLKETARKWGAASDPFGTSGRPSRRTAASRRSLKEPELSEEEGEERLEDSDVASGSGSGSGSGDDDEGSGEEGSDGDVKPKTVKRARNAKKDEGLAFLSSESESD